MRPRLVIIGANEFQLPLIKKAGEMGYETHVFAWEDGAVGKSAADYFYPISIVEKETILDICKKIKPEGVVSIGSDLAVITVNYITDALGLNGNSVETTEKCTNKYAMRRALLADNIPVPKFQKVGSIREAFPEEMHFPVIVKPTDRSGSRSITKVNEEKELEAAIKAAVEVSFEKKAIIEEYIAGEEYSCECISYHGEHHFLALTKKYTTGAPHYIETGHMQPSGIDSFYQEKIRKIIFRGLDALGIKNGASHSEFKLDAEGNIGIIEIGARMGGDCIGSHLVYLSTGYDFLKMVIDVSCGKPPLLKKEKEPCVAKIRFLFNQEDIRVMERKKREADIFYISDINYENEGKVEDSSTRLGYYIWCEKGEGRWGN